MDGWMTQLPDVITAWQMFDRSAGSRRIYSHAGRISQTLTRLTGLTIEAVL